MCAWGHPQVDTLSPEKGLALRRHNVLVSGEVVFPPGWWRSRCCGGGSSSGTSGARSRVAAPKRIERNDAFQHDGGVVSSRAVRRTRASPQRLVVRFRFRPACPGTDATRPRSGWLGGAVKWTRAEAAAVEAENPSTNERRDTDEVPGRVVDEGPVRYTGSGVVFGVSTVCVCVTVHHCVRVLSVCA